MDELNFDESCIALEPLSVCEHFFLKMALVSLKLKKNASFELINLASKAMLTGSKSTEDHLLTLERFQSPFLRFLEPLAWTQPF